MGKEQESNGVVESITDAEVRAVLRYLERERTAEISSQEVLAAILDLDPDCCEKDNRQTQSSPLGLYVFVIVLVLYFSVLVWIYFQVR